MNPLLTAAGGIVLAAAWFGPLPRLAQEYFTAHMILHVCVVALAAPLIGAGLAEAAPLRRLRLLFAPIPASLLEFLVVWGWHAPWLHRLARSSTGPLLAEQASFFVAGFLLWAAAFRRRPESSGSGILALLLTSMHMILLGTLLTLAPRPLYHRASDGAALLEDQQLGGVLMLLGGGVPYLAGALWLTWRLLQPPPAGQGPGQDGFLR
jgi:putative membrane protein